MSEGAAEVEPHPCGSPAAYRRHLRHGEPVCDRCSEAEDMRRLGPVFAVITEVVGEDAASAVLGALDREGFSVYARRRTYKARTPGEKRPSTGAKLAMKAKFDPEARDELRARKRQYKRRAQDGSVDGAERRFQEWTGPELEVAARSDLTTRQVAEMLGRTYAGVEKARHRLRKEPREDRLAGTPRREKQ